MADTFKKFDTEKEMVELVEPEFILGIAKILTLGAHKYSIDNWKQATDTDRMRIKGALLRHQLAYNMGELIDSESGLSHLYHVACNAMFLDYFDRQDRKVQTEMKLKTLVKSFSFTELLQLCTKKGWKIPSSTELLERGTDITNQVCWVRDPLTDADKATLLNNGDSAQYAGKVLLGNKTVLANINTKYKAVVLCPKGTL